jgi:Na+/H+ antiporter NhaD/arsenite permease-like protein
LTFLLIVLGAVFIKNPPLLREAVMLAAALASWFSTHEKVHEANHFDIRPLREVAVLFVGIFATMMPALDWLELQGRSLSNPSPAFFYWGSGLLSSFLDNAPTYLGFLSAALGTVVDPAITHDYAQSGLGSLLGNAEFHRYVLAISVGSVFFGANTYIGNGPNFMVKAIADQQKVATPGFLGLIWKYSLPILGPMLILVWLLFFRA